ncbi:purine and uridine phosphorylase [Aspergillus homomorphus CBS 101889]|uniref:Purine and uridine phosphorylase n=1 Tax=Aspergillus homomorphus (strain CBS 101889) TaxID=1450537 RepID=A0A395IE02_ASPHC|nr:purine and uridine phosphorylase [Aspergillus homomorphus CBS 101889]RAL17378.1 purine and uridine phosphorylase [Aspergillus homomorphus CBS 101889]
MNQMTPIQLLLESFSIVRTVADSFQDGENHKLGKFFGHLNAYSFLMTEHLLPFQHQTPELSVELERLIHTVLNKLTAFLRSPVLPEFESALPPSTRFRKLTALVRYWELPENENDRLLYRRDELILLLRGCVATLQSQLSKEPPIREHRTLRRRRSKPCSVWMGADTVFQALFTSSRACSQIHTHESAARLRLATHRKHDEDQYKFETLVSLNLTCHIWQETHIRTTLLPSSSKKKKAGVKFCLTENNENSAEKHKRPRLSVMGLCEQIEKLKSKRPLMRLNLSIEDGRLWKDQSSQIEHPINRTIPQISLKDIIKYRPTCLTEKVKRVLAVLLAYSVLHLHGTPWLRSTNFHPDKIFFFATSATIPLKPYIHTDLDEPLDGCVNTDEDKEVDPDDLPSHPYPDIVMLAIMLIELYVTQPLQSLAREFEMQCEDWAIVDDNTRYSIAIAAFDKLKADFPDNYREAVDRCLDPNIGLGPNDDELSEQDFKRLIYDDIVQPLEDELDQGFGNTVHIDRLDEIAQTMDLSTWGQMRPTKCPLPESTAPPPSNPDAPTIQGSKSLSQMCISWTSLAGTMPNTRSHRDYTVGWVCALPRELAAAQAILDEIHLPLPQVSSDQNNYTFGRIGPHNIVMACLPAGVTGTVSAARVANNMMATFLSLKFGLMVGIGGGVPGQKDIRLGDVVVGEPFGPFGGVIQYDFGKTVQNSDFRRTGSLNRPPDVLLTAVSRLKADHLRKQPSLERYITEMLEKYPDLIAEYSHPGVENDILFASEYDHVPIDDRSTCDRCDPSKVIQRQPRTSHAALIHYGLIASGNKLIRDGKTREKLRKELDVICFEMEAAGIIDVFPCLVIRGICDYADTHKNKVWQGYAAATAAAYAKELLSVISGSQSDNAHRLESIRP